MNRLGIAVMLRWGMCSRALTLLHDMRYSGMHLDQFPLVQSHTCPGMLLGLAREQSPLAGAVGPRGGRLAWLLAVLG